ncbi:hypothetical protein L9F63_021200, partial [Diploptera punctata]
YMALHLWIPITLVSCHLISLSVGIPFQGDSIYYTYSSNIHNDSGDTPHLKTDEPHAESHHGIHVANWRWDEIGVFFTFTVFILVSGLAKVAFHHATSISEHIPESCTTLVSHFTTSFSFWLFNTILLKRGMT